MRVVSWNVRQGGGPRAARIVDALVGLNPDVVLIGEHRARGSARLSERLTERGLEYQLTLPDPLGGYTALLLASRHEVQLGDVSYASTADGHRVLHGSVPALGWEIVGVYMPNTAPRSTAKLDMWRFLTDIAAPALSQRQALMIGDFNTGLPLLDYRGKTLQGASDMQRLLDSGWRDAWKALHPGDQRPPASWWSTAGNPFRLDHCFMSPGAPDPVLVDYPMEIGGRPTVGRDGMSDHTPLVVDVAHELR